MMGAGATAIFTGIGSFITLAVITMITNSLVEASIDIRDVQTNEHADDIVAVPALAVTEMKNNSTIYLNGYWGKSTVTVSFRSVGMPQSEFEKVTEGLRGSLVIDDEKQLMGNSSSLYGTWPELLQTLSAQSENVPTLQLVDPNSEAADIKVFFEAGPHPEGKPGSAKIGRDKATFEILFAEVRIYSAYDLYTEGYIKSIFEHEMGHAIGLGHAGLESSIMHTPMLIVNNTVYAGIQNCEFDGASSLYIDRKVKEIQCYGT
jgi:hypothetical protein